MAKDQMFQTLCSISTWKVLGVMPNTSNFIFSCPCRTSCSTQMSHNPCVSELLSQHKYKYSCALDLLAQHKTSITHVLQSSSLNTLHLINHVLQGPCPTHENIYIYAIGLCPTYQTNQHVHIQWGLRPNI